MWKSNVSWINTEHIQIRLFSSIIQKIGKDFSNEIKGTNIKLKNYCLGKDFIFQRLPLEVFYKEGVLKIFLQNSKEITCARVSF